MELAAPVVGLAVLFFVADAAGRRRLGNIWVVALCLIAIFAFTLGPVPGENEVQLRPGQASLSNDVQNVILFAPFGASLLLRRWPIRYTAIASFVLSVAIELTQLSVPGRTTSLDDVIFNTLGGAAGWLVARALWPPGSS